jgi:hypothetical protein
MMSTVTHEHDYVRLAAEAAGRWRELDAIRPKRLNRLQSWKAGVCGKMGGLQRAMGRVPELLELEARAIELQRRIADLDTAAGCQQAAVGRAIEALDADPEARARLERYLAGRSPLSGRLQGALRDVAAAGAEYPDRGTAERVAAQAEAAAARLEGLETAVAEAGKLACDRLIGLARGGGAAAQQLAQALQAAGSPALAWPIAALDGPAGVRVATLIDIEAYPDESE